LVYRGLSGDGGLWFDALFASVACLSGSTLWLHHHSYRYIHSRDRRMGFLTSDIIARRSHHILLSPRMRDEFLSLYAHNQNQLRTTVLDNCSMMDDLPLPTLVDRDHLPTLKLSMIGNVTFAKGLRSAVELLRRLDDAGVDVELKLLGPVGSSEEAFLDTVDQRYRVSRFGSVDPDVRLQIYSEADVVLLDSSYAHEAQPLVVYEALLSGCFVIASVAGDIPSQLSCSLDGCSVGGDALVDVAFALLADIKRGGSVNLDSRKRRQERAILRQQKAVRQRAIWVESL
jgi:glycosyltransferase involved in cell wall biosynthesis